MNKKDVLRFPLVSIVIPVYNGSDYLAQAIDSALGQDYPNIEVVVVNDGSEDHGKTERIALSYGHRIRYFCKKNGGVATALNMGIQEMQGEYFSWLSHDDLYGRKKISAQMKLLHGLFDKTAIIAGGYAVFTNEHGIVDIRDYNRQYQKQQLETPLFPLFHCAVNGCTLLIHKSHFQRAGLFDPKYPTTQDYDLWFRMMRGRKILYGKGIHMFSRAHQNQGSLTMLDRHNTECEAMWIRFMDQVTDEERTLIAGSPGGFYREVHRFFFEHTSYFKAAEYARSKLASDDPAALSALPGTPEARENQSQTGSRILRIMGTFRRLGFRNGLLLLWGKTLFRLRISSSCAAGGAK